LFRDVAGGELIATWRRSRGKKRAVERGLGKKWRTASCGAEARHAIDRDHSHVVVGTMILPYPVLHKALLVHHRKAYRGGKWKRR